MKNGDAIMEAVKTLAKEIGIGVQAEYDGLKAAAEKAAASCKDGSLKDAVEKNAAVAGAFISAQVDALSRELQKAKEQAEIKIQAKKEQQAAQAAEETVETVEAEIITEPIETETPAEDFSK